MVGVKLNIKEQRVVVTGAAGGIGRAIAELLAAGGARVMVNDVDGAAVTEVAQQIGGYAIVGDAATVDGVDRLVREARQMLGGIDIYFANAGVDVGAGLAGDESAWAKALEVNVMAHVRAADALVPDWLERGRGRFVATASAAGLLTLLGNAPYSVSKHAAVAFAEWLSVTYGHRGVTVQVICPQGVRTDMLERARSTMVEDLLTRDAPVEASDVAQAVLAALDTDQFFVLPHPQVASYYRDHAADPERWLGAMRRLQRKLNDRHSPSASP